MVAIICIKLFFTHYFILEDIKTIYYSSTGLLYQINLNSIVIDDTTYLSDKYELIHLGSTKQVLFKEKRPGNFPSNGYVVGGVNYDSEMIEEANHITVTAKNYNNRGNQGVPKPEMKKNNQYWKNIPYSDEEVEAIKNLFKKAGLTTDLKRGQFATESSIKSIGNINTKSPEVIHISTHGYFFSKPENQLNPLFEKSEFTESVFQNNNHPLIRSG
ncbi:MAG: CHAT domain-containing protein [Saprospiraceae bacterium]|nr:CHAT domain-containing protein [Saprospiraceae bacterium]